MIWGNLLTSGNVESEHWHVSGAHWTDVMNMEVWGRGEEWDPRPSGGLWLLKGGYEKLIITWILLDY